MKPVTTQVGQVLRTLRRSAWTLPLAGLAALLLFAINEAAYDRSATAMTSLGQRGAARTQVQLVWRALTDAETWQRSYLLTGRPEHRQPYEQAVAGVQASLAWLGNHYGTDADARPLLTRIDALSRAKLSELETTLVLRDQGRATGREEAWRELMLTDIGREKMQEVREVSQQLLDLETQRVGAERRDVLATVQGGRLGINLMTGLSLLALFLFLWQTLALDRAQRRHAADLQIERDRLEAEVTRRTADLTELARHLQNAREEEKARLARELHDELGALLTAVNLDTARLKRLLGPLQPSAATRLKHLHETISRGIELKRRIIENLRPSSLSSLGVAAALEILVRESADRHDAAAPQISGDFEIVELSETAQITVYRLVQEALANAASHADARHIEVRLQAQARDGRPGALVSVQDDGTGFDPTVRRDGAHGLIGMRYRVEAEGGHFEIDSAPGAGTRVVAWLPQVVVTDAAGAQAGAEVADAANAGTVG